MKRILRIALFPVLAIFFIGCGGGSSQGPAQGPAVPRQAATLTIVAGNIQTGTVAQPLPTALAVRVLDNTGAPVPGIAIAWRAAANSGSVSPASASTSSDGTASANWMLGTTAGPQEVSAVTGNLVAQFSASARPGPGVSLQIAGPSAMLTDEVISLTATEFDAYRNSIGPRPDVTFWVATESVVKVNRDNTIVGMYPGTVTITAAAGNLTGSHTVTVNPRIDFEFGAEQVVFRYATDRCGTYDLPDQPARFIRLADQTLLLIDSDEPDYYASFGPDFNSLNRDCTAVFHADHDQTPQSFNNREWLWAPYRDSNVIHVIVHNEYHDPFSLNCLPGDDGPANPCWYNSLTYATSTDGGHTFTHAPAPQHVLAPPAWIWDSNLPSRIFGYFESSNIIHAQDGRYYAAFRSISPDPISSLCIMRTADLSDPTSWRAWDGVGFNSPMANPYLGAAVPCQNVGPDDGFFVNGNLTYNSYLQEYMLLGSSIIWGTNPLVCGIAYMTSPDLIHWTREQIMLPGHVVWPPCNDGLPMMIYGAVVDHNDTTENFEYPGRSFYLYYTRFNDPYLDRDLVRVGVFMIKR